MIDDNIKSILESIRVLNHKISSMPGVAFDKKATPNHKKIDLIDENIADLGLRKIVAKLFKDGHHARAVEEAFKYIDNLVKKMAKPIDNKLTGAKLMNTVFNPTSPLLRFNSGSTYSETDEQNGYMQILIGCMLGIRNPRAHEHDWEDTEQRALQLLIFADHLVIRIKGAEKVL